ncbi:MAG: alpha/beta hydrolase [Gammaproteobacteria bacterium]|nr:alpha/beta hydrolase [Gammaproteobacteria bacterium]MDP6535743.1 alpha/beta hydrolase [Gammaproteobacteria bacterium]MDP6734039.1 alpha/beta hydrolase [Gammaproteobacteria bacterium]
MYCDVNGNKTFYSTGTGTLDPQQASVIFIHGAGLDHSTFVLASRYFARQHYNVFAPDFPGHGRSAGEPLGSITDMADWIKSLMEVLKINQSAIVGYSMGSLVALQFAAAYPQLLRCLVLVGTSIPMPVADPLLDAARDNQHDAIDMANTWSHSRAAQLGGNENPGMSMMMSGQRLLEHAGQDVFFTDLNACNEFTDSLELARKIQAETLLLVGEQDQMTAPVNALQVAGNIDNCRVQKLSPCGHAMFSEQPNQVLDALISIV